MPYELLEAMPFILKTNYMNENLNPELPENNLPEEVTNQSVEEEAKEQSETSTETSVAKQVSLTKDEIIEKLKNLTAQTEIPSRAEVESLKQAFYKLRSAAIEEQKAEFIEAGLYLLCN